jgi:hypothetical protein
MFRGGRRDNAELRRQLTKPKIAPPDQIRFAGRVRQRLRRKYEIFLQSFRNCSIFVLMKEKGRTSDKVETAPLASAEIDRSRRGGRRGRGETGGSSSSWSPRSRSGRTLAPSACPTRSAKLLVRTPCRRAARKWRRKGLKRLNPGREMVWARKPRTHNIWYTSTRLTVRDSG